MYSTNTKITPVYKNVVCVNIYSMVSTLLLSKDFEVYQDLNWFLLLVHLSCLTLLPLCWGLSFALSPSVCFSLHMTC